MPINSKSKSILLVDDDSDIVNLFKDLLENKNCEVIGFTNPLEALEHYKTNWNRYGLVISDIRMPVMNGFEFVRKARKINPKVKILLMTAFEINDKEFAQALPKPKIDGLIRKPATSKEILSIVSTVMKR